MAKNITIRKATIEDVSAIIELWKELMDFSKEYDEHWSRFEHGHENFAELLRSHIADDAFCILVAELGEDIIGYCFAEICQCNPRLFEIKEYGHISNVVVTEEHRREGVGEKLLQETRKWLSAKGVHRIEACVSVFNEQAKEFWAKMGYIPYLETVFLKI